MKLYKPVKSTRNGKKFMVNVWDPDTEKIKTIHFGNTAYEDYTQHKNKTRKANYLTRSAGITNGLGEITKDDPRSANYWSRRFLWDSREPYYVFKQSKN